jgi:hypothetical protein
MAEPFRIISEDETEKPSRTDRALESVGMQTLLLGLGALSKRAIVALQSLFVLLATASAFTLWWSVLPSPSVLQLTGLGMYAMFVLAASVIVRKL